MTRRGSIDALAARLTGLYDAREARSIALAAVAELSGLSPSALLTDPEAELAVEGLEESAATGKTETAEKIDVSIERLDNHEAYHCNRQ